MALAAGYDHSLGLKSDGSIVAWGWNYYGQCDVPEPNTEFVALAAGYDHSLGLKSDGSIVAWGNNGYGQCNVPAPNAEFVSLSAGSRHSLGLKSDGSIVAWGRNNEGQCSIPAPNTEFVALAAGWSHSLGLKSDRSIVAWGQNDDGQCNVSEPNTEFVALAAGEKYSFGLKCTDTSIMEPHAWNGHASSLEIYSLAPNPFNPRTVLSFTQRTTGPVQLSVFDIRGRLVLRRELGVFAAGQHQVAWDGRNSGGRNVASGTYFLQLTNAPGETSTARGILLR